MKATLPLKAASKTQQKQQQQQVIDINTYTPGERNAESKKRSFFYSLSIVTSFDSGILSGQAHILVTNIGKVKDITISFVGLKYVHLEEL